jgi:GNAT superfamily N-acetyltransferase
MDVLGALADLNMAETWMAVAVRAGGSAEQRGPLHLAATGIPVAFFNSAFLTAAAEDPVAIVDEAIGFMSAVPWLLWVREGVDEAVVEAGRRAGLSDAGGPPAMGLAAIPPQLPRPPMDLEVTAVDDAVDVDAHCDLLSRAFGMPLEIATRLFNEATVNDPAVAAVLGRVDGEPVSTAMVSVTGRTAGVYNVATAPDHQRKGYGAALTWAAIGAGRQRGGDHAILQASPAGQPVYEMMGFTHLGRYVQLQGPPQR